MMKSKVILISIDGMRPDGVLQCGNPYVQRLIEMGSYTMDAQTVFPSVTLPCHMSMFHSVPPERHGITTNLYMPQVRPVSGLFEQAAGAGLSCAMYYGWEPLRDISRPGSLRYAEYIHAYAQDATDGYLTDRAIARMEKDRPDFAFLYMVETDEKGGHDSGWMTDTYLGYVSAAIDNARRVIEAFGDEYTVIITADHGGHGRGHGSSDEQDMTIPMFFVGKPFPPGQALPGVSILDLAPTIAAILGVPAAPEWEGKVLP